MPSFWDRVRQLDGQTLKTIAQGREFDVVRVTHDRIVFRPRRGKGTERWWPRKELEELDSAIASVDEMTPERVRREWPSDQNTSYVAAILRAARRQA